MSADTSHTARESEPAELARVLQSLEGRPVSMLCSHNATCCRVARGWFRAMARSAAREFDPDPWPIASRWPWGPTRWPVHWCEAVNATELDCGALASLSAIAFGETGHENLRVQLIQTFSGELTQHWARRWRAVPDAQPWIWDDLVYHEAVGLETAGFLRLWNPTESCWISASAPPRAGQVLAMRTLSNEGAANAPRELHWEGNCFWLGQWTRIS